MGLGEPAAILRDQKNVDPILAMDTNDRRYSPERLVVVMSLVAVLSLIIAGRLVQMQFFQHSMYVRLALEEGTKSKPMPPTRGVICDSRMGQLAASVVVDTVVAEPRRIKDLPAAAHRLAAILDIDATELLSQMTAPANWKYLVVKERVDPHASSEIDGLEIAGIYLIHESMRVYPDQDLAGHTLGLVNRQGEGVVGLELEYNGELKGTPGTITFSVDAYGRPIQVKSDIPPVSGHTLVLSIDRSLQCLAAKELLRGLEDSRASAGTAIIMESETGRILAIANYSRFNSSGRSEYQADPWWNRAIQDVIEPGSTFKVVVVAAALEARLARPDELIDCHMGSMLIGKRVIHDHKPYGLLTLAQVLEYSSNIGAAELGMRLGKELLCEAVCKFGFGSQTGIDLPAERAGRVRDIKNWSDFSVASISFGQEIGVTSMQIITAINAIANGGYRVRPSIVDRVIGERGQIIRARAPELVPILRPETAAQIRDALEGVVLRGTGRLAALEGYRAAGKTGTAQKAVGGHISKTKYLASFVGFAPLPRPRVTILVQIDEPQSDIYGGDVAAPVFQRIAQETLIQLHVPADKDLSLSNHG